MPQVELPIFPEGATIVNTRVCAFRENETIIWYNGSLPVFNHAEDDLATFRMFTGQLCVMGVATQAEIARVFGVTPVSVKRSVKLFREKGVAGFYAPRKTRGATVLIAEKLAEVQSLLSIGSTINEISKTMDIKADTIRKAVKAGKLILPKKKSLNLPQPK